MLVRLSFFSVVLMLSVHAQAQVEDAAMNIALSANPIHIFFPGRISEVITESQDVGIRNTDKNAIELKVVNPSSHESSIEVVLQDGRRFTFLIDTSNHPEGFKDAYSSLNKRNRKVRSKDESWTRPGRSNLIFRSKP